MYIPFEQLPSNAKVWIYQSDRKLSETEQRDLADQLMGFIDEWTSHSTLLKASFAIMHDFFIILAVDNAYSMASGCSIDKSVQFLKSLGKKINVDFLNRLNILTLHKGEFLIYDYHSLKEKLKNNNLEPATKIFNNLVESKSDLDSNWLIDVEGSWLKP